MTQLENIDPIWVNNRELFNEMLDELSVKSDIGIDTESDSLYAYTEKVCLI